MKKQIARFLMVILVVMVSSAFSQLKYNVMWSLKGNEGFSGPNEIRDPATGKTVAIVVAEVGNGIVCLSPQGERLWQYAMTPPVTAYAAVGDVDGDGAEDIVAADAVGNIVLLDHTGKLQWQAKTPGGVRDKSCATIADLNEDGRAEILIGDISGYLSCFDSNGKLLWRFQGQGTQMGPPLVADIYETKGQEIIVTSHDRHIYALSAEGQWLWDIYCDNDLFPNSTPILADINNDDIPELYIGGGLNHFYQINLQSARIEMEKNVQLHINDAICSTDFNGDGKTEIIFGNKGGVARGFTEKGFAWKTELDNASLSFSPIAVNFDEDPDLEIMFAHRRIQILNPDGSVLLETGLPSPVNSNILAGEFDGDGYLETILSGYGMFGSNTLLCLKWNVPYHRNPSAWTAFAGNRAHTGRVPAAEEFPLLALPKRQKSVSAASFTPVSDLKLLGGENKWRFDVQNPEKEKLLLLTTVRYPDNSMLHFARHIYEQAGRVTLQLECSAAGRYKVEQTLVNVDRRTVLKSKEMTLSYKGLSGDKQYLTEVLFKNIESVVARWRAGNAVAADNMNARLEALKGRLIYVATENKENVDEISAIIRSAERLQKLAVAGEALAADRSFFAWSFSPWAWFDPIETLATPKDRTRELDAELCMGEYESIAVNITNVTSRTLELRILADELSGEKKYSAGQHLQFRRAVPLYSIRREPIADALPLLDEAQLLTVPPLETRQLWITVNAIDMTPGDYLSKIRIKSIEPDPSLVTLPLRIKVHDLALPQPGPLRFCVWAHDAGHAPEYELKDLIEHGVTVHFGVLPKAQCNAAGELVGTIDFADHDAVVKRLAPHGIIMFLSPQSGLSGQPFLSDAWSKAFIQYLRTWIAHLKELGLSYEDWAFYPYDEPSSPHGKTIRNLVKVAKLIRQADPKALIYTDPTSGTTMESINMLSGLIDIWCPSDELIARFDGDLISILKPLAKEVWFYAASGRSRTLSPLGLYRQRFWYAWNAGLTGAGWWTYYYGDYLWDGPNPSGDYFSTVYTAPGAIVTSKRWEAAREGMEDYEILFLLKQEISRAKEAGADRQLIREAEKLLDTLPKSVQATLLATGRRIPITPDGVPAYEHATRVLQDARRQIIEMCLRLKKI